jgi:hypothetical protein
MILVRRLVPLLPSLVLALSASACTDRRAASRPDTEPAPVDAPPALTTAHEAYLAGDYVEMGDRIKDVLVDPRAGDLARDNAFALLESAYEATHGRLPARAALPDGMRLMTLGVLNGANPFGANRLVFLSMRVVAGRAAHVKDIRLTRLPGEPILALTGSSPRGELVVSPAANGLEDVKLQAKQLDVLPDRGAFEIHVAFDDGPGVDAVVLANKLVASAQPEITSPAVGQVLTDPRPEFAWLPFRSPEYAPWEARAVHVGVSRESKDAWTFYKWDPGELGSVHVGEPATLEPGPYWMSLLCMEQRMFGGIWIMRLSETAGPFSVVR